MNGRASLCASLLVPALVACAAVSPERERRIGREEAARVEQTLGLVEAPALHAWVAAIGQRLVDQLPQPRFEYRFLVVDAAEPNAFALPGGWVYLSRGLLALVNGEDELAGVIGHEIGHVSERHAARRMSVATPFAIATGIPAIVTGILSPMLGRAVAGVGGLATGLVVAPYSRQQERDADRVGLALAAAAGWDPGGLPRLLETLQRDEALHGNGPRRTTFLASHPATPERVRVTTAQAAALAPGPGRPIAATRSDLLARLDGLLVGANPAEGVLLDGEFMHPTLGFLVRFPQDWETANTATFVAAASPDERSLAILQVAGVGDDPVELARAELDEDGLERLERVRIGGLPAARLAARGRGQSFEVTWISHGGRVYRLVVVAPTAEYASQREKLRAISESFRPLEAQDRERIRAARLRVRRARAGETLEQLVARSRASWSARETAVANALAFESTLEAGQLVKVAILERYAP